MRPLAPAEIRVSFVNCSRGEARKLSLPAGLDDVRCVTTHAAADGTLFSARRVGAAGRNGNTLGIYACGDLGCCQYVRARRKPSVPQPAETITTEERVARLHGKVTRFVGQVLAA